MVMLKWKRRRGDRKASLRGFISRKSAFRLLLITLAFIAILPPIFFHFKLKRLNQLQLKRCTWLTNPPLVCAHGGDASKSFPNTMAAYRTALHSQVDCIEIDVSRSSDGVLVALHDRDLQRISGNNSSRVGYMSRQEIKELDVRQLLQSDLPDLNIPTIEDALKLISGSVRKVILDAKVGPPSYEKGLAKDILSVIEKTECRNCIVWAKSDNLVRDVMKQSSDVTAGYIVMMDHSTGRKTSLLRMRDAGVVGVYHPLIEEKTVQLFHRKRKKVYAWTVDDEASMQKILYENVDGIVTSNPTVLQRLMEDIRTKCLVEGFSLG